MIAVTGNFNIRYCFSDLSMQLISYPVTTVVINYHNNPVSFLRYLIDLVILQGGIVLFDSHCLLHNRIDYYCWDTLAQSYSITTAGQWSSMYLVSTSSSH